MAPYRERAQHRPVHATGNSLAVRHGVQSNRAAAIVVELVSICRLTSFIGIADLAQGRANWNVNAAVTNYNEHLQYIQNQMQYVVSEHAQALEEKDATIRRLERKIDDLDDQNSCLVDDLHDEKLRRKVAAGKLYTNFQGIKVVVEKIRAEKSELETRLKDRDAEVDDLYDKITVLKRKLSQEKAKNIADKGSKEKLETMTEKWTQITKLVEGHH
jgi:prefoldin subunit 5